MTGSPLRLLCTDTCLLLSSLALWGLCPCVQMVFWETPTIHGGRTVFFRSCSPHLKPGSVFKQALLSTKCGKNSRFPEDLCSFSVHCRARRKVQIMFTESRSVYARCQLEKLHFPLHPRRTPTQVYTFTPEILRGVFGKNVSFCSRKVSRRTLTSTSPTLSASFYLN